MNSWFQVLILASLPAFGNFLGGILAEFLSVSNRYLSFALHGVVGVILGIISIEIFPLILATDLAWINMLAFLGGGIFFIIFDSILDIVKSRIGYLQKGGAWTVFFAVSIDLFSDGVMIGTSSTIAGSLSLILAIGQLTADIPEGFATIASLKKSKMSRSKRLLLAASFAIPVFLGAAIGYWILVNQPDIFKLSTLAFTAGMLLTVTVEEIIPEIHKDQDARFAALFFIIGIVLFALLSIYLK